MILKNIILESFLKICCENVYINLKYVLLIFSEYYLRNTLKIYILLNIMYYKIHYETNSNQNPLIFQDFCFSYRTKLVVLS